MGSCSQADGMERNELVSFIRIDPFLSIYINFNLIGHWSLTFYMIVQIIFYPQKNEQSNIFEKGITYKVTQNIVKF